MNARKLLVTINVQKLQSRIILKFKYSQIPIGVHLLTSKACLIFHTYFTYHDIDIDINIDIDNDIEIDINIDIDNDIDIDIDIDIEA